MRNEDTPFSMADVDLEVANDDGNTMPSADEVRQTHAMSGGDPASVKKSRRRCWMGAVLVICAIGIIAGTAGGKGNERGNAANTGAPRPRLGMAFGWARGRLRRSGHTRPLAHTLQLQN